jgi:hypothetical protein
MRKVPVLTIVSLAAIVGLMVSPAFAAIGNAPSVNDNNRVVGMDGGNIYYNGLVPGGSASSIVNLGLPAGGGGSPGSGTGAAGLVAAIADLDGNVIAQGAGSANANGLTVTLDANGSYSLTASANFNGAYYVALGSGADIIALVAAEAVAVDLNGATFMAADGVAYSGGQASVTVAPGAATLVLAAAPVAAGSAGDLVTLSMDYNTPSTAVSIAIVGFDGGINGSMVKYSNAGAAALAQNITKNLATSFVTLTGQVQVGYQVFNSGTAAVTVTLENFLIVKAGPVPAAAMETEDVALGAWGSNLFGEAGYVDAVEAGGTITIAASGGKVGNAFANATLPQGEIAVSCKAAASNTAAGATLILTAVALDGGMTCASFVDETQMSGTVDVATAGTNSSADAASIIVVQSSGGDVTVTDVAVTVAKDVPVDPAILGL